MRTRTLLATLILMVICGVSSGGCQILSGLTVLQVTGGTGGEGGGAECTTASDCGKTTECSSHTCDSAGKCQHEDAISGTPCGATCGDGEVTSSTCNGSGECTGPTTKPCSPNYGCNPDTNTCNTTCSDYADCSSTGFCVRPNSMCTACGTRPPPQMPPSCKPGTMPCETCETSSDTCIKTCDTASECNGPGASSKTLDAGPGPVRLVCDDQCNNTTVTCQGPSLCEVVCNGNGCNGLTMKCSPDGPCKLICQGTACAGMGVSMQCGENECLADHGGNPGAQIEQMCGGSCGCSKTPGQ